ncbi:MAG TPA: phage portal protein, partial [Plasticicumulans sp.]|nr:phage portal protein [Plasticicumulans sp.]
WQEFGRNIESWRWQMLMPQGLDRIGAWFLEAATAAGYDTAGLSVRWTPPSRMLVDPARETQPIIDQIRSGLISPQEAIRERGYDPDQVLAEWQEFAKKIDELGLILDIDPRVEARRKAVAGNLQEASTP